MLLRYHSACRLYGRSFPPDEPCPPGRRVITDVFRKRLLPFRRFGSGRIVHRRAHRFAATSGSLRRFTMTHSLHRRLYRRYFITIKRPESRDYCFGEVNSSAPPGFPRQKEKRRRQRGRRARPPGTRSRTPAIRKAKRAACQARCDGAAAGAKRGQNEAVRPAWGASSAPGGRRFGGPAPIRCKSGGIRR